MRAIRLVIGIFLVLLGTVGFIIPGSTLFLLAGLLLLSVDFAWARRWLKHTQRLMRKSANRVDSWLLRWKFRKGI